MSDIDENVKAALLARAQSVVNSGERVEISFWIRLTQIGTFAGEKLITPDQALAFIKAVKDPAIGAALAAMQPKYARIRAARDGGGVN